MIRIETFSQSGIEAGQLAGKNVRGQAGHFRQVEIKFDEKVGSGPGVFVRPIGNRQRRPSQPLDFLQDIALGVESLLGQQEYDTASLAQQSTWARGGIPGYESSAAVETDISVILSAVSQARPKNGPWPRHT